MERQGKIAAAVVSALVLSAAVVIGYASLQPRRRSKRLIRKLDKQMQELEQRFSPIGA